MDWWKLLGIPAALLAVMGIGTIVGGKLAWSIDIQRLDRKQAAQAVEIYSDRVERLIVIPAPNDPTQKAIWQSQIEKAIRERDAAEKRSIELGVK